MPQLPEDIIDRLTAMERRIQQLSTAVNSRPALNKVSGGGVEITDGGWLHVLPPSGGPAVFSVGGWEGDEFGLAIRRQTGNKALTVYNGDGSASSSQALRIFDTYDHEVFADDVVTGGLARPWLAMLPPQDVTVAHWPQTTATTWTTIAASYNPVWQPKMQLYLQSRVSSGAAGSVRVLVGGNQWGDAVSAGSEFNHTDAVTSDFDAAFGSLLRVEIQAMVTSTSGTVYAQPQLMYGRQS
ncbi:hypothetical protein [Streptomyces sp. NPDC002763]|uniref:hypothetical protein n=1 Tax=Streptomyces sp. NPDC002763 TaxID=3154427 RepID=UPI0033296181